jgi:hypothetical protein
MESESVAMLLGGIYVALSAGLSEEGIQATACGTCDQSWIHIIYVAIRRLAKVRLGSSKREQILPNELPNGLCCSGVKGEKV